MSVIQVGDLVKIRIAGNTIVDTNKIYKVETIPDNSPASSNFWELSYRGDLFIVDGPILLLLEDGAP